MRRKKLSCDSERNVDNGRRFEHKCTDTYKLGCKYRRWMQQAVWWRDLSDIMTISASHFQALVWLIYSEAQQFYQQPRKGGVGFISYDLCTVFNEMFSISAESAAGENQTDFQLSSFSHQAHQSYYQWPVNTEMSEVHRAQTTGLQQMIWKHHRTPHPDKEQVHQKY